MVNCTEWHWQRTSMPDLAAPLRLSGEGDFVGLVSLRGSGVLSWAKRYFKERGRR